METLLFYLLIAFIAVVSLKALLAPPPRPVIYVYTEEPPRSRLGCLLLVVICVLVLVALRLS